MVEKVFVGGCPSGKGGVVATGASACEKDPSGRGLGVITEVGAAVSDESLAELNSAVTVVPEGRT